MKSEGNANLWVAEKLLPVYVGEPRSMELLEVRVRDKDKDKDRVN